MNTIRQRFALLVPAIIIAGGLFFGSTGFAGEIILKSGTAVEGEILHATDNSVTLDFYGTKMTIYRDEIDRIEGVEAGQDTDTALETATEPDDSQDSARQDVKSFIEDLNMTLRTMKVEVMEKENLIRDLRGRQESEKLLAVTKALSATIQKFAEDIQSSAIPEDCRQLSGFAVDYILTYSKMYDQLYQGNTVAASDTQELLRKQEADLYQEMALAAARHNIKVLFP